MPKKKAKSLLSSKTKKLIVNYTGGLGYYLVMFGWAMLFIMFFMEISKFVLHDGTTYNPAVDTMAKNQKNGSADFLFVAFGIPLIISINIFIVATPYYLGKYMRRFSNWLVDSTSLSFDIASLMKVKIAMNVFLVFIAIIGIFSFNQSVAYNMPSYIIYGCALASVIFFIVQYALAKFWKMPYDDVN